MHAESHVVIDRNLLLKAAVAPSWFRSSLLKRTSLAHDCPRYLCNTRVTSGICHKNIIGLLKTRVVRGEHLSREVIKLHHFTPPDRLHFADLVYR
jgi:hypothetical protein